LGENPAYCAWFDVLERFSVEAKVRDEGAQQRPADLRELQDRPPKGHRAGDLYQHEA
jgi:hypothetical protein